ncbi:MAG: HAMP domain-containing protein [Pseudomonadota bacterium]
MKLSFSWKLGIVITLLSVGLTSICVTSFYYISYKMVMSQIGKNMLYVGRLGALMLDDEARDAIKRLTLATEKDSIVSADDIAAMKPSTTLKSLSQENIDRYHGSRDFKLLRDVLCMVTLATVHDMEPRKTEYRVEDPLRVINNGAFAVYIAVPIKESPNNEVWKYLVSPAPEPTADGWPGNPIGNLAKGWEPLNYLFLGKSYVDDRLYTDEFYTSLSAAVPILNKDGSTLAIFGIDYAATEERNQLIALKYFSYGLVFASLLLSIFSSMYMAHRMGSSLRILSDAAQKVAENDFSVSLDIKSKDEFAILGKVFNQMIVSIRKYMLELEEKNKQLATIVLDMHDGVGAILSSIAMNSAKDVAKEDDACRGSVDRLVSINHLARKGLVEVRFLMNVLDYDQYDYSVIVEEIKMQSADILAPSGIEFQLEILGDLPRDRMEFRQFLDLQRIFREIFVNIVKHSKATHCAVALDFRGKDVAMKISDNGSGVTKENCSGGRGLKSLMGRAQQLGGKLEYHQRNGFHIEFSIPNPGCANVNQSLLTDDISKNKSL